ncbi:MAG: hypothetical protein HF314_18980 [Ignavibacteria bacterium]|jgi:hypothetical protein|nr:hypothetical protein [Ignavibacteria bacterium]MCU7505174.1 hypothetical protein [Ignavibacteria bacterium]MCU7518391.1 hypothetical protein [Ignavibacteria bacterium]
MMKLNMKRTMRKARKTMDKVDWSKTAHNVTSIAGTLGGAIALTKVISQHRGFRRRKWFSVAKAAKIGAASLSIVAAGIRLFNDNLPGQAKELKHQYRHYSRRYRKMLAF